MIDIVDVADRFHRDVVLHVAAVGRLDLHGPLAGFRTEQHDFARLFVMHYKRVRIRDHVDCRRFARTDVVDYVALPSV